MSLLGRSSDLQGAWLLWSDVPSYGGTQEVNGSGTRSGDIMNLLALGGGWKECRCAQALSGGVPPGRRAGREEPRPGCHRGAGGHRLRRPLHDVGKGMRRADVDDGAKPGVARRARCGKRVGGSSCWSRRTRSCAGLPAYFRRRICGERDLPAREELAVTSRARWLDGEQRTRSRARVARSSPRQALTKGDEARFTWGSAERCRVSAYSSGCEKAVMGSPAFTARQAIAAACVAVNGTFSLSRRMPRAGRRPQPAVRPEHGEAGTERPEPCGPGRPSGS